MKTQRYPSETFSNGRPFRRSEALVGVRWEAAHSGPKRLKPIKNKFNNRGVAREGEGRGGAEPHWNLADQLTLFKPGGRLCPSHYCQPNGVHIVLFLRRYKPEFFPCIFFLEINGNFFDCRSGYVDNIIDLVSSHGYLSGTNLFQIRQSPQRSFIFYGE